MRKHMIFGAVATMASVSFGQTALPLLWQVDSGSRAWFQNVAPNLDQTRGMDFDVSTSHVLVADRDSVTGNVVRVLDAATGADLSTVPNTYSGGTFVLNKVTANQDGTFYVTNLAIAGSNLRVYRHADISTTQTTAHAFDAVPARLGDEAVFRGTGNNTRGIVLGSGNPGGIILTTTDGGLTFNRAVVPTITGMEAGINTVAFDPDFSDRIWIRRSTAVVTTATQYIFDASAATITSTGNTMAAGIDFGNYIDMAVRNGNKELALVRGTSGTPIPANLRSLIIDVATNQIVNVTAPVNPATSVVNGNGAGAVRYAPQADRLFVLVTNNSIAAHGTTVVAAASDWNLYDN